MLLFEKKTGHQEVLWNPTPDVRSQRLKRQVVQFDQQGPFESERYACAYGHNITCCSVPVPVLIVLQSLNISLQFTVPLLTIVNIRKCHILIKNMVFINIDKNSLLNFTHVKPI